jgi:uncharacterized NAD(P)/FAD-binding protein YdhS
MIDRPQPDSHRMHVVIVGGGASGALTAVQLLRRAAGRARGLRVTLIDQHGRHGLGVAYSTTHDSHLLNAPSGQMSALPDDPRHLVRWANAASRGSQLTTSGDVTDMSFLPRAVYGAGGPPLRRVTAAGEQDGCVVADCLGV